MKKTKVLCPHCGAEICRYSNPFPTVDLIIEVEREDGQKGIVLIFRKNEPKAWALPGGFVDYGETLEQAAVREAWEETGLEVESLKQFHTYSDPRRDPRQHNISTVFTAKAKGMARAGDDAGKIGIFSEKNLALPMAFDHQQILRDYFEKKHSAVSGQRSAKGKT